MLNQLQSRGHYESAVFMQKIRELEQQLKQLKNRDEIQQLKKNKTIYRVKNLVSIIEKGPERLLEFPEQLFQRVIDKLVITGEGKIIFYLISGFQLEEVIKS